MPTSNNVNLGDIPDNFAGGAQELSEGKRAQIKMTYWVLAGALALLAASGLIYIWTDNGIIQFADDLRVLCTSKVNSDYIDSFCSKYFPTSLATPNLAAKEFFEFCKNFVPPVVTLVLGAHYVTRSTSSSSED